MQVFGRKTLVTQTIVTLVLAVAMIYAAQWILLSCLLISYTINLVRNNTIIKVTSADIQFTPMSLLQKRLSVNRGDVQKVIIRNWIPDGNAYYERDSVTLVTVQNTQHKFYIQLNEDRLGDLYHRLRKSGYDVECQGAGEFMWNS